jgi:hypothetical protein
MKLFFLDDARQNSPSRPGMHPLIAAGGFCLPDSEVARLERSIDSLCRDRYGFPPNQEFKYSPGRELWMRSNLIGDARFRFFQELIQLVGGATGKAFVIIKDCEYGHATGASSPERDGCSVDVLRASV